MKFAAALALSLATVAMAHQSSNKAGVLARANQLDRREANNRNGKCCAKNKDGSGGMDVPRGGGREDCGFCFTGKCKS
ncbi:hypothetical protein L249_3931 [Ophiocordyceps polyrhachis-furcata BCC 54312]|uniref:Uncharacterized protein n=1 Tax=Ophiocordyceps polyrhachis-furcata BCC 54312 TaxID=1330021 RepID=A0A367L5P2_9HYPO|nr:hypothetical protein L249_3931 [Ophiocordyceps polyrhachis-furcata BCC 54312]